MEAISKVREDKGHRGHAQWDTKDEYLNLCCRTCVTYQVPELSADIIPPTEEQAPIGHAPYCETTFE